VRIQIRDPGPLTLALAVALSLSGCGGGGSPTAPATSPTPAPTPPPALAFADGLSGSGVTPQSITPASPKVGDMVTAVLDGYLTREQKWTGPRIELWPVNRRGSQRAYEHLVYGGDETHPLYKWASMSYTAVVAALPAEWADKEAGIKAHFNGVFASVAGPGGPLFSWASSSVSSGNLTVRIDPTDDCLQPDYAACTRWWHDGSTLTRVELLFSEPDHAVDQRLTMHMMGTAIGLDEWDENNAVMNPMWCRRPSGFHEFERNAIHMMYQHRNAGNVLPDRDPGSTSAGRTSGLELDQERLETR
jgi:hypothetical protein